MCGVYIPPKIIYRKGINLEEREMGGEAEEGREEGWGEGFCSPVPSPSPVPCTSVFCDENSLNVKIGGISLPPSRHRAHNPYASALTSPSSYFALKNV